MAMTCVGVGQQDCIDVITHDHIWSNMVIQMLCAQFRRGARLKRGVGKYVQSNCKFEAQMIWQFAFAIYHMTGGSEGDAAPLPREQTLNRSSNDVVVCVCKLPYEKGEAPPQRADSWIEARMIWWFACAIYCMNVAYYGETCAYFRMHRASFFDNLDA